MSDYEIREFRPGDEGALLAAFNRIFADADPSFRPRTRAEWDWAFRDNPAGFRIWLAFWEGQVVAQYAALPCRVWIDGRESTFAQIVDSMVDPEHRAGLKRPGLFVRTAWPFFDEYGAPGRDVVHYGWPIEPAWRVGKTFLNYEVVRTQLFLARAADAGPAEMPEGVERIERFDHSVRALYERCVPELGASTIRDPHFMNWRYVDNPYHEYVALGVPDGAGGWRGVAVHRHADWVERGMGVVVDWLVPSGDVEAGALLLEALVRRSRATGSSVTTMIMPEWSPWFERIQEQGFHVRPSGYFMVARNFERKYDMLWLRDHWWYQIGDTDLV